MECSEDNTGWCPTQKHGGRVLGWKNVFLKIKWKVQPASHSALAQGGRTPLAIWIHPVHPPAACCWVFGSREARWGDDMKGCQATCLLVTGLWWYVCVMCDGISWLCDKLTVWQDAFMRVQEEQQELVTCELVPSPRSLPSCHLSPNYPGLVTLWWIVTPWQPRLAPPLYISYWQVFRGH